MPRTAALRRDHAFDPGRYRGELRAIIEAIAALPEPVAGPLDEAIVERILRRHPRDGTGFFSRSQLIAGFRHLSQREALALDEGSFLRRVQRRPVRSLSGVTPVTVFTKPFPCPGRCVFCPNDVRMPKSYLSDEPGAQRAADHRFDPYLQTWNRLAAYRANGHPTDKVEVIVLGGTWSSYDAAYRRWFVKRVFEALNDFGEARDRRAAALPSVPDTHVLPALLDGREHERDRYNRVVGSWLRDRQRGDLVPDTERAGWQELEAAQRANEAGRSRCVGLSLETRPDHVTPEEVTHLRRLGATKVQIGIQSLSDSVLAANQRGHDVAATREALRLLRAAGFKLHAHWMPNLLGASPASDIEDFDRLFEDPAFRPDELKVYPCSLVESAELFGHYTAGAWRPYGHEELLEVVIAALERTPRWCRLTRVIRDISSDDIVVGNKLTNFREIADRELRERGGAAHDIRSREIRAARVDAADLALRTTTYATSIGDEVFAEFVTRDDRIAGFLRLALPDPMAPCPAELRDSAIVRELHVYGSAESLGVRSPARAQHRGLGTRLLTAAERIARDAGYARLAVISAIGTRRYYAERGYELGTLYQHKAAGRGPAATGAHTDGRPEPPK